MLRNHTISVVREYKSPRLTQRSSTETVCVCTHMHTCANACTCERRGDREGGGAEMGGGETERNREAVSLWPDLTWPRNREGVHFRSEAYKKKKEPKTCFFNL